MKKKNNLQAYAFLTPFLILVTLLYILPAVLTEMCIRDRR